VRLPTLLGAILLLPMSVEAQQVATSFEELQRLVKPDDTIYVTDTLESSAQLPGHGSRALLLIHRHGVPSMVSNLRPTFSSRAVESIQCSPSRWTDGGRAGEYAPVCEITPSKQIPRK
jgi:hypothetical protein